MDTLAALLAALHAAPGDDVAWLALADWLEENDRTAEAELLRRHRQVRLAPDDAANRPAVRRVRDLIVGGVKPVWPTIANSVGMDLALIPPGVFRMGGHEGEPEREDREGPVHEVEITRPFYLAAWPVTQAEYETVLGTNPAEFSRRGGGIRPGRGRKHPDTSRFPVETVTWDDAGTFCAELSRLAAEKAAGRVYRLPTEAEWEYACRGWLGSDPYWLGTTIDPERACCRSPEPFARSTRPERDRPCPVASFAPNPFGLYDLHGGVWEWCADWFDDEYYQHSPRLDPAGPAEGFERSQRGGCWGAIAAFCRSACREMDVPDEAQYSVGFRVAMTWPAVSRPPRGSRRRRGPA